MGTIIDFSSNQLFFEKIIEIISVMYGNRVAIRSLLNCNSNSFHVKPYMRSRVRPRIRDII